MERMEQKMVMERTFQAKCRLSSIKMAHRRKRQQG